MFCGKCGSQIPDKAAFCPKCGAVQDNMEQRASETVPSAGQGTDENLPASEKKKKLPAGAAVGIAATVFAVIAAVVFLPGRESDSGWGSDSNEQQTADGGPAENKTKDLIKSGTAEDIAGSEPVIRNMNAELTQDYEENVRDLYEQRILLREAVRTIVAQEIENTSILTVDPREQFSVTEVLIDEATGNPVASEGVKQFLQAATEGKSIQDMCQAAVDGSLSQIPDYLKGKVEGSLQDVVTSYIGIDIFTPISTVSEWMNPDQEPIVLLQGIVEEQQKDVSALALFLQQEEISTADIYKVAQMVHAVDQRTQEISAAQGGIREILNNAGKLRELAEQYADVEAQLAAYAEMELPDEIPEYDEEEKRRVNSLQAEGNGELEKYEALYSLSIGNVAADYDVEGFRESQKTTSQVGMVGNMFLGDLIGGLMGESAQVVEDQIQQNRRTLCDMLTNSMEESYVEVVSAQGVFMEQYSALACMSKAEGNEMYFADIYLKDHAWKTQLEETAQAYMAALARYITDLENANFLYNCILTPQQVNYLFDLQIEIDSISQALSALDPVWAESGYSNEELLERWSRLVGCYTDSVSYILERGAVMGDTPGFHYNNSGKYDGINYNVYTKEFTAESRPVLIVGGGKSYYYDMNGNVICVDASYERIIGRSFYVLSYQSYAEGAELKTFWDAGPSSPEMQQMSEQSIKAKELYSYFWGGSQ